MDELSNCIYLTFAGLSKKKKKEKLQLIQKQKLEEKIIGIFFKSFS